MWLCSVVLSIFLALQLILNKIEGLDDSYKLPNTILPLKYNLTIEPIFNKIPSESTFTGSVSIEFTVIEDTKNITLNVRELQINETNTSVTSKKQKKINILNSITDEEKQFHIINLEEALLKWETYNLKIYFCGNLTFDKVGFYLAKYNDADGNERILAVTDFQPSGARKAFPCFDEPAYKANFVINMVRNKHYVSISNEELNFTKYIGDDRFQDTYKQTVKMSTYLVAFVISDYEFTMKKGRHRIFAKHEAIDSGKVDYVLSISDDLMTILENFTGTSYSLNKLDELSIPSEYFIPGGMENWGLITISEENLFCYNSTSTTTFQLQKCTTFTTHEFSHQWFGNLVTPSWWKYLWLSEGLATYLEYYITSLTLEINTLLFQYMPSWKLMDQFVIHVQQKVFEYDGNVIKEPLNSNPEILGMLPSPFISYYKGACVIRMIENFLTHHIFEKGIKLYLQQNQFDVVEPSDLYEAFQKALIEEGLDNSLNNFTVKEILSTWDSSSGYPLVSAYRDYTNGSITLIQNNFFPHNIFSYGHIWYTPISVLLQPNKNENVSDNYVNTTPDYWLTEKFLKIDNFTSDGWILINKLQTGYYRVSYDITNWKRLSQFLYNEDFNQIHVANRAQLIDDAFNLAKWGYLSFEIPLNLSKYLVRETNYIPLASFFSNISFLKSVLIFTDVYRNFQNYIISILNGAYNYLDFEEKVDDSHLDKLNRVNVLTWLSDMGHQGYRDLAFKKFREWKSNKTSLTADMEIHVFCGAIQTGSVQDWNFLYKRYQSATEKDQKLRIFSSLGCSRNETILKNFLDILFAVNNTLSFQIRKSALEKLTQTSVQGIKTSFNYLINHISGTELTDSRFLIKAVETICKYLSAVEVMQHLDKTKVSINGYYASSSCLSHAKKKQEWMTKGCVEQISKWLLDHKQYVNLK